MSRLKAGDHVQSAKGGLGTWREYGNHDESHVFPIDVKGLSAEAAATIQVSLVSFKMKHLGQSADGLSNAQRLCGLEAG